MPRVAVVAHAGKSFGGGLAELRKVGDDYMVEHWLACYAVLLLS
jgi:hypothetical protein